MHLTREPRRKQTVSPYADESTVQQRRVELSMQMPADALEGAHGVKTTNHDWQMAKCLCITCTRSSKLQKPDSVSRNMSHMHSEVSSTCMYN